MFSLCFDLENMLNIWNKRVKYNNVNIMLYLV